MIRRFKSFAPWARVGISIAVGLIALGIGIRGVQAVKVLVFGNVEAKRERGGRIVAEEQTQAEGNIADRTIESVRERDVFREHVREIVSDGQGKVNDAWDGETVGGDVDAAGTAALCRLHDSLCRRPGAESVQPLR